MNYDWRAQLANAERISVHPTAEINVTDLVIGDGAIIGPQVVIEGARVHIGRAAWLDRGAYIGGGSCYDPCASLEVGDFLHMGRNSHINLARPVKIGHEFGCGIETKVFAHGAYLSEYDGFPVQFAGVTIGDRVWLPNAWVNPGVTIGSDVVVAARSLINRDLPTGCLAGGIPARVLRENCYPIKLALTERIRIAQNILTEALAIQRADTPCAVDAVADEVVIRAGMTEFWLDQRCIYGSATAFSRILQNQLRRHGLRFRYEVVDGVWREWQVT